MRKVKGSHLFWIAGAGSLVVAAAIGGCSSKSSGNNAGTEEDGGEDGATSSSGGSSSGAGSSSSGSSGAGSSSSSSGAGSSSSGSSGGVAEASTGDGAVEAASSSGGTEAGTTEAGASTDGGGDASCTTVNVYNFHNWCSVSINGGTFSTGATVTACVTPGTVSLVAQPAPEITDAGTVSNFELGPDPWVYISGTGGTDSGISGTIVGDGGVGSTSTTSVTVGGTSGCVLVCCPFGMDSFGFDAGVGCSANATTDPTFATGYATFLENCQ